MLADDGRVADVAVAETELVVGEADGPRIVRALRLFQGAAEQRDRRATARRGRSPDVACRRHSSDSRSGCSRSRSSGGVAQRFARLADVVLLEPGLGERAADLDGFIAGQAGLA